MPRLAALERGAGDHGDLLLEAPALVDSVLALSEEPLADQ
jgi:hypothetical protein